MLNRQSHSRKRRNLSSTSLSFQTLSPKNLDFTSVVTTFTAGSISGGVLVIYAISFAALIFSGDLSQYVSTGIGLALFTVVIMNSLVAVMSSIPGVVINPQEAPAIILGLIASGIVAHMSTQASSTEILDTVMVAIALTSILTSLVCFILGTLKLGDLARCVPYSVIGGFLAGTGWLLSIAAIQLMTDVPITFAHLPQLWQPEALIQWLPGVGFAALLLVILRRYSHVFIMPGMVFGAIALFYLVLLLTGTSIADARNYGLLLSSFPEQGLWHPPDTAMLLHVNWQAILEQSGKMLAVIPLTVIALLLNNTGIELATHQDVNLNRELRAVGIANFVAGLGGGIIGFHALGLSALNLGKIGAKSRWVGLIAAAVGAITLIKGGFLVSLFPKPILGGIALFLGLSFLVEWVYDGWFRLSREDYFIVILILVLTASTGSLQAIAVGLVGAIVLSVIRYSRTHAIRTISSGADYSNRIQRIPYQKRLLGRESRQICTVDLQGFLFFGNGSKMLNQVRHYLNDPTHQDLKFIILNFELVKDIDAAAIFSILKLEQVVQMHQRVLVYAHIPDAMVKRFHRTRGLPVHISHFPIFQTLEQGLAWCENQILEAAPPCHTCSLPLALRQEPQFCHTELASLFLDYLEEIELHRGQYLCHQDDSADWFYFIESGQMRLVQEGQNDKADGPLLGAGNLVGEVEFYCQSRYYYGAIALETTQIYGLSRSALYQLKQDNHQVADAFQEFVIRQLSQRLNQKISPY